MAPQFKAYVLNQQDGKQQGGFQEVRHDDLPKGDVLVKVQYSSLNYKDGLAVTGKGKIARSYPMVPGIDFAGIVEESSDPEYKPGDEVVLTGWGVGERHWGGFAEYARVSKEWLIPAPPGLSLKRTMAIGTAGFTAMLAVQALETQGLHIGEREVLVTGASGGVGSIAVAILAKLGYNVTASSGKSTDYLQSLGAKNVIGREVISAASTRPLESERWAGAIDTVGGETLAGIIRSLAYHGSIAVCGNAGGMQLSTTVIPFILRGANLLGIESVMVPKEHRLKMWERLVHDLPLSILDNMTEVVRFEELPRVANAITEGQIQGRIVIDLT
ncbi:MAG: MDR family oxidoreductase [Herpetosiphon sp.]